MTSSSRSRIDGGYGEAKRLGGLEVQDHLVFHRKLHREIARLLAAQNVIDLALILAAGITAQFRSSAVQLKRRAKPCGDPFGTEPLER